MLASEVMSYLRLRLSLVANRKRKRLKRQLSQVEERALFRQLLTCQGGVAFI